MHFQGTMPKSCSKEELNLERKISYEHFRAASRDRKI